MYRIKSRPDMPKNGQRNSKKKKVEAPEEYPKAPGRETTRRALRAARYRRPNTNGVCLTCQTSPSISEQPAAEQAAMDPRQLATFSTPAPLRMVAAITARWPLPQNVTTGLSRGI